MTEPSLLPRGCVAGDFTPEVLLSTPGYHVVSKPPFWLAHQVHGAFVLPDVLQWTRDLFGEPLLAPAHRLDRETSGVTVLTRDADAARRFFHLFRKRAVGKVYLAIVEGWPTWNEIRLDAPLGFIGLSAHNPIRMKQGVRPDGKAAVTAFRVLGRRGPYALVEARPSTGRMHQIRAHLAHLGHPIVGDKVYGRQPECYLEFIETGLTPDLLRRLTLPRQALHASQVIFPVEGVSVLHEAPLTPDLQAFWDAARSLPEAPRKGDMSTWI